MLGETSVKPSDFKILCVFRQLKFWWFFLAIASPRLIFISRSRIIKAITGYAIYNGIPCSLYCYAFLSIGPIK